MEESVEKERHRFDFNLKNILFISFLIGIIIRLACMPLLSYEYDDFYWAKILQNINSGNGLYEIEGYYYTPVWGYIIGAYDVLWSFLSPIGELGLRVPELFGIEEFSYPFHSATVTNPLFICGLKSILVICDILVGYLIYKEAYDLTKCKRKSEIAFALWFLCPIVIYMSSIQCMFDCISALFTLMCFISARKNVPFISGLMLAIATLLKVFPVICLPIVIAYIFMKNRGCIKDAYKKIALFIISFISMAGIIIAPDIAEGDVFRIMSFLTNRMPVENLLIPLIILGIILTAITSWIFIKLLKRSNQNHLDNNFRRIALCLLLISIFLSSYPCPQYFIVIIPLLAIQIAISDKGYVIPWLIISIATTFKAIMMNNFGLLSMAAKYYGTVSYDWIISMMKPFDSMIGDHTLLWWLNGTGDIFVNIASILIILFATEHLFVNICPKYCSILDHIKYPFKNRKKVTDE